MPRVPYSPVSDVPVAATPPEDYQRIQSSPAEFGGLIAGAAQHLGAEAEQAGNNLAQIAEIRQQRFNQIAGDDAMNKFMEQGDALTYGNPNDPTAPKGLYSLKGAEALRAGPEVTGKITQLRDQIKSGLQNDAQRLQFDEQSRRYYQYKSAEISRHLDEQANVYGAATTEAGIAVAASQAGNTWNSDDALMHNLADAQQFADKNVGLHYGANPDPAIVQQSQIAARTRVVKSAVEGAMASDPNTGPARAAQIVQKFGGLIDPGVREQLTRATKDYTDQISLTGQVQGYLSGSAPTARPTPSAGGATLMSDEGGAPPAVKVAIKGNEGSGPTQVSVNGASGEWQVTPGFFQQYAKPGETYSNETDRAAVAQRGLDDKWKLYGDPSRVAVAYFSGDGNVAPPGSATPWVADKRDGNGTLVSTYVRNFQTRLQQAGYEAPAAPQGEAGPIQMASVAGMPAPAPAIVQHSPEGVDRLSRLYLNAPTTAQQLYPNNPVMQQKFVQAARQNINELMLLQNRDEAERQKQRRDAQEQATGDAITAIRKDPTKFDGSVLDARDTAGGYVLDPAQRENLIEFWNRQLTESGHESTAKYGPGFLSVYRGFYAEPGDPTQVNSLNDIVKHGAMGDLSPLGVDYLSRRWRETRQSPDAEAISRTETAMLNHVHNNALFPEINNGITIIKNREGEDWFNASFVPRFESGLAAAKNSSTRPGHEQDVWNYLSRENVDKMWQSERTQRQIDKEKMEATGLAPDEATIEKPGTPIPPAPQGLNAGEWSHIMTLPPTVKGVSYSHQAWATVLQRLAANPVQGVKDFNERFGAAGYDGQQILERLKKPESAPANALDLPVIGTGEEMR